MKIITALLLVLFCISVQAQNRVRRVPPRSAPPAQQRPLVPDGYEVLKNNHVIRLHGTTSAGKKVDLSVTGVGKELYGDCLMTEDVTTLTYIYKVLRKDDSYLITYSIGSRIRVTVNKGPNGSNYEYRDVLTKGTVVCEAGKDVEVYKNDDKGLYLSITEVGK